MGGNQRTAPKVIYSAIGSDFSQVHVPVIQYQGPCGVSLWLPDVEANLTPINKTPKSFQATNADSISFCPIPTLLV